MRVISTIKYYTLHHVLTLLSAHSLSDSNFPEAVYLTPNAPSIATSEELPDTCTGIPNGPTRQWHMDVSLKMCLSVCFLSLVGHCRVD